jgi:hypothetical protein
MRCPELIDSRQDFRKVRMERSRIYPVDAGRRREMVCAIVEVVRLPNAALRALPNDFRNAASSLRRAIVAPCIDI